MLIVINPVFFIVATQKKQSLLQYRHKLNCKKTPSLLFCFISLIDFERAQSTTTIPPRINPIQTQICFHLP